MIFPAENNLWSLKSYPLMFSLQQSTRLFTWYFCLWQILATSLILNARQDKFVKVYNRVILSPLTTSKSKMNSLKKSLLKMGNQSYIFCLLLLLFFCFSLGPVSQHFDFFCFCLVNLFFLQVSIQCTCRSIKETTCFN